MLSFRIFATPIPAILFVKVPLKWKWASSGYKMLSKLLNRSNIVSAYDLRKKILGVTPALNKFNTHAPRAGVIVRGFKFK